MKHRVLIVDDSKLARMGVMKLLKSLHPDWEGVEAANADEALARVKEGRPEFVLLDYNMPGKDGVTLAAELKALDPSINVVVVSANHQVEVVQRAQEAGAAFLPKPLTEGALAGYFAGVSQSRTPAAT